MSVDVHSPVQFPLKRFAENHELLEQEHLTSTWLASLWVSHNQRVLKRRRGELEFNTREGRDGKSITRGKGGMVRITQGEGEGRDGKSITRGRGREGWQDVNKRRREMV